MGRAEEQAAHPRYRRVLAELQARGRFGVRLGLARTRALLRALGHPERDLRGVLIGGTNGKGSVQALVAAGLREAGAHVGQTPKPHLVSYRERILIDGQPLAPAEFGALFEEVLAAAERVAPRHGPPTEFELVCAAAFSAFSRAGVEFGVVEVGMGGRLDATNAWQGGLSAITNVALDHREYLGPTVAAIAREKAQIIKRGDRLALTGAEGEALTLISRRARRVGVPLHVVSPLEVAAMDRAGIELVTAEGEHLRVALLGRHQAANAALALAILRAFAEHGLARVPDDAVRRGFAGVRWPGRLELLALERGSDLRAGPAATTAPQPGRPDIVLDGAHNPHGAAALAAALDELRPQLSGGRPTLLIGILRDKEVAAMLACLLGSGSLSDARIIATAVPGSRRSLSAGELAAAWRRAAERAGQRPPAVEAIAEADAALAQAAEGARRDSGPLIVCGSLYLVGHVRRRLLS